MTKPRFTYFVSLIIVILIGCSPIRKLWNLPTISSLNKLKYENDSIFLDFKIDIPKKTLYKKVIYVFKPIVIINNTDSIEVESREFYGEKIGEYPKVSYKYGGEFHVFDTIKLEKKLNKITITEKSYVLIPNKVHVPYSSDIIFEEEIK